MSLLLDVFYLLALLALTPWLLYKAMTTGKYRAGWWQKLAGSAPVRRGDRPCAWFHGVSVGEVHLLRQVVAGFRRRHPDWECVVSTTTETGYAEARRCFPELSAIFWPFDFTWAVRRALARIRPRLVVLAEGELWPNFLAAARRRRVPVAVVNGRMSPRGARRYRRLGWLSRRLFAGVDLLAAQTAAFADAYRGLGALPDRIRVTGSIKYDGVQTERRHPRVEELRRLFGVGAGDLVWVAGSTQEPEEGIVHAIYRRLRPDHPSLRLLLVPRQREGFDAVARLLEGRRQPFVRRSALTGPVKDREAIILIDTIGELCYVWGLADVAFVGGSLDGRRGGQNMIEPAAYGAAVVFGPHVWNFAEAASRLVAAGAAVRVKDGAGLEAEMRRLLAAPAEREVLGTAARRFVLGQQGATERTLDALDGLMRPLRARGAA